MSRVVNGELAYIVLLSGLTDTYYMYLNMCTHSQKILEGYTTNSWE